MDPLIAADEMTMGCAAQNSNLHNCFGDVKQNRSTGIAFIVIGLILLIVEIAVAVIFCVWL